MNYTRNLLHPYDVVKERQEELINAIISSYPEEERERIIENIQNAIFIFDSTPDVTYDFIKYADVDKEEKDKFMEIYQDYMTIKESIEKRANTKLYEMICAGFGIDSAEYIDRMDEIINLDAESYGSESTKVTSDIEKKYFEERRKKYIEDCERLGIEPITRASICDILVASRERSESEVREKLMDRTMFGRQLTESILDRYNKYLNGYELSTLLFSDRKHSNMVIRKSGCDPVIVSHVPLIRNAMGGNADLAFLEELRMIAETNEKGVGFVKCSDQSYSVFNGLRILYEAQDDERLFYRNHIFSPAFNIGGDSSYEEILPHISNFFLENKKALNNMACVSDVASLEKTFGTDIKSFAMYLGLIYDGISKYGLKVGSTTKEQLRGKTLKFMKDVPPIPR